MYVCTQDGVRICKHQGLPDGMHISVPKIPALVYFGRPWNETFWCISCHFGIFVSIYYILCPFWYIL
jgi:hypothetical protein